MSDDGILHFNPWMDFNDGPPSENPFGCDPDPEQIAIFLGTGGHLDSVPVEDVARFEQELLEHVKGSHSEILENIRESKKFPEEEQEKLTGIINEFKKGFYATDGSSVAVNEHEAEAMDEEDVEKESVKVRKPAPKK